MLPFASLVVAASVAGQAPVPSEPKSAPPTTETSLVGGVGGLAAATTPGVAVDALGTHRIGPLELGFEAAAGGGVAHLLGLGALAGVHVGDRFAVRALAAFGVHAYRGIGRSGLLGPDPGVSGNTRYIGGRLMLSYSFSPKPKPALRVLVGLLGALDRDLERYEKSSSSTSTPWLFGGEPQVSTWTHSIGQTNAALLAVLGIELDLSPYY